MCVARVFRETLVRVRVCNKRVVVRLRLCVVPVLFVMPLGI